MRRDLQRSPQRESVNTYLSEVIVLRRSIVTARLAGRLHWQEVTPLCANPLRRVGATATTALRRSNPRLRQDPLEHARHPSIIPDALRLSSTCSPARPLLQQRGHARHTVASIFSNVATPAASSRSASEVSSAARRALNRLTWVRL